MIKQLLTITAFVISFTYVTAQDTIRTQKKNTLNFDRTMKPIEGDMAVSFDATGIINNIKLGPFTNPSGSQTLALKYFFKDAWAFRFGLGINAMRNNVSSADSSKLFSNATFVQTDSTYKKTNIYLAPGVEKHILTSSRIDPYFSGSMILGFLGGSNIQTNTTLSDTLGIDRTAVLFTQQGGISFGLNIGAGFNFFITKKLSLGAEYGLNFGLSSIGGDWQRVTTHTDVGGTQTNIREIGATNTANTLLKTAGTAGLTLTYFFEVRKP